MIEPLEQRRLLVLPISGSVIDLDDSPDVPFITAGNDVIEIILSGGNIQVRNGAGIVQDQRSSAGITGISVNGQAGNDFIRLGRADGSLMPNIPITIRGGSGDDTIIGGLQADQLFGDDGNDRLDGRAAGDIMNGGIGFDTADYSYRSRSINVSLTNSGTANDGTNTANSNTPALYNDSGSDNLVDMEGVIGSSNQDLITGSSAANWLEGGGGNDTIFGGAGIDTITGGVHTDLAYGENDADFFFMQDSTADQFLGGAGTTSAQYDAALDTPAPAAVAATASFAAEESAAKALVSEASEAEPGQLLYDDAFGFGGKIADALGGLIVSINDVAIQTVEGDEGSEEKIIVVGTANIGESDDDFLIARFLANGDLDTEFGDEELGQNGVVLIDFGNGDNFFPNDVANSVAIGAGGKIIVAGGSSYVASNDDSIDLDVSEYAAARLNQDGTLDADFGSGGKYWGTPDNELTHDEATRVVIQNVGEVEAYIITGTIAPAFPIASFSFSEDSESADWGTIRLNDNGTLDDAEVGGFGLGGLVITDFSDIEFSSDEYASGLAIDPETNNIWIAGTRYVFESSEFAVAGYDQDGNPIDGAVNFYDFSNLEVSLAEAYDAVISDSRLIVVGEVYPGGETTAGAMAAFSINPDDAAALLASSFVVDDSSWLRFTAVEIDNNGYGVVAGNLGEDYYISNFDPVTLSQLGSPVIVDFGELFDKEETFDFASGVAVQSDGMIVVAGTVEDPYAGIVRLFPEPTEEPPFVDVELDGPTVQSFQFFIAGNTEDPVPAYLVDRLKSLKPDGSVELSGTEFDDVICVSEEDGIVTISINGELFQYNAAQVTKVVIDGLGGNDVIKADKCLNIPVQFSGGSGHDLMVGADLNDTFFGGTGNDLIMGLKGDDCIDGEGGNDLLIGGWGNDKIFGGDGRDLLIGGLGADTLRGGADEDIVIGGFTIYDFIGELLIKLHNEWCFGGRSWSQRFNNLSSPFARGYNGLFFLKANWTVYNDHAIDDLGGGGGNDWFFADTKGSHKDKILDKTSGDHVSSH